MSLDLAYPSARFTNSYMVGGEMGRYFAEGHSCDLFRFSVSWQVFFKSIYFDATEYPIGEMIASRQYFRHASALAGNSRPIRAFGLG